ncbi:MAG TPA: hypothetical protein VF290_15120 [Pyrinomonadaceae bacterium]
MSCRINKYMTMRNTIVISLLPIIFLISLESSYAQTPDVKLHYDGRKLYTRIDDKEYLIDEAAPTAVPIADALVDPGRTNVYYVKNTGCGFENEGTTLFVADVRGGNSVPILSRCLILTAAKFLNSGGRTYLLIKEENGGTALGTGFWLFDVGAKRFEVHAEGELTAKSNNTFSYGVYNKAETLKPLGTVTLRTLINRGRPLRLMPRQPTRALTVNNNTKLVLIDPYCGPLSDDKVEARIIKNAGSEVLIAGGCPDGDYQVYFQGTIGKIAKRDLNPLKSIQLSPAPK